MHSHPTNEITRRLAIGSTNECVEILTSDWHRHPVWPITTLVLQIASIIYHLDSTARDERNCEELENK